MNKRIIILGLIMIGYTVKHESWELPAGKERDKLEPIVYKSNISDLIPIEDYDYPQKCFGSLELTKQQQKEIEKFGCYCPLMK